VGGGFGFPGTWHSQYGGSPCSGFVDYSDYILYPGTLFAGNQYRVGLPDFLSGKRFLCGQFSVGIGFQYWIVLCFQFSESDFWKEKVDLLFIP